MFANNTFATSFVSAAIAEVCAGVGFVPADILSQRLQVQNLNGFHHNSRLYKNVRDVAKNIYRKEGWKGFFRGYIAHVSTFAPGSAMHWGTYEFTRQTLLSKLKPKTLSYEEYLITAGSGALGSLCATTITNPLDVIRIRQQLLDRENPKDLKSLNQGYLNFAKTLLKERGPKVFFKGLPVRLSITLPGAIVAMCGYETVKSISETDEAIKKRSS